MRRTSFALLATLTLLASLGHGCGSSSGSGDTSDSDAGPGVFLPDDGGAMFPASCTNLCRAQPVCLDTTTFLTGTVRDPSGKLPVYNAIVYVPNAAVPPVTAGASCDRCGVGGALGSPLVAAVTDANGAFVLKDMPAGKNVPLVVQVGKWRRQLVIPQVTGCMINPLADIRLPKKSCEGDLPQLAITTGGEDALECWLRKIGIDDSELTSDTGTGHVHLYAGSGGATPATSAFDAAHGGQTFSPASALWSDESKLARYDAVLLSCEGDTFAATKPAAALSALEGYTKAGGRVLASHWQHYWFSTQSAPASPFTPFATWNDRADPPAGIAATIDGTYPKGAALKTWLGDQAVLGLDANGRLPLASARHNVDAVVPTEATQWASFANANAGGQTGVALLSSNLPGGVADAQRCGRVTFADFHASPSDTPGAPWPGACSSTTASEAEKALEFFLFDLTSCVQADHAFPTLPKVSTPACDTPGKCDTSSTQAVPVQTAVARSTCAP